MINFSGCDLMLSTKIAFSPKQTFQDRTLVHRPRIEKTWVQEDNFDCGEGGGGGGGGIVP